MRLLFRVKAPVGTLVDIPGFTFAFTVRLTPDNPTAMISKTGLVPSGPSLVTVQIASADTVNYSGGTYAYGLARTNAGAWDVEADGAFVLSKSAAHAA